MAPTVRRLPVAHSTLTARPYWNADAEAADPTDLRRREDALLREQLARTSATSRFYREKWANAGVSPNAVAGVPDLETLPFTEKYELQSALAAAPPVRREPVSAPRDRSCGCRPPAARRARRCAWP